MNQVEENLIPEKKKFKVTSSATSETFILVCVCVCVCARACARACVRACVRTCVRACVCVMEGVRYWLELLDTRYL